MSTFRVTTEGLADLEKDFAEFPKKAALAGRIAVNYAADKFARRSSDDIQKNLRLGSKAIYNASNQKRSGIRVEKAKLDNLTAIVSASSEPLPLGKFATNAPRGRIRRGLSPVVAVKPNANVTMAGAFYVRVKNGTVLIAVRLKPGDSLRNKTSGRTYPLRKNDPSVVTMYGPSVDQAFKRNIDSFVPQIDNDIRIEFTRQLNRLLTDA